MPEFYTMAILRLNQLGEIGEKQLTVFGSRGGQRTSDGGNGNHSVLLPIILIKNKANSTNLYPPTKGYLRETCKSQNINPIYLTLSSPTVSFRSLQTPVKYVLVLSSIKNILTSAQFQYLTFKPNLRGQDCV